MHEIDHFKHVKTNKLFSLLNSHMNSNRPILTQFTFCFFFLATLFKMTTMRKHDIQMSLSFYPMSTKIIATCANIHNGSWMSGLLSSSLSSFATIVTDKMSTMKNLKKNVWRLEFHKLTQFFFSGSREYVMCPSTLQEKKKKKRAYNRI